jgi:hypothetical protein
MYAVTDLLLEVWVCVKPMILNFTFFEPSIVIYNKNQQNAHFLH